MRPLVIRVPAAPVQAPSDCGRCSWAARTLAVAHPEHTWEVSHVGGCRFAANLLVLPDGVVHGGLDVERGLHVAAQALTGRLDAGNLRGRTGASAFGAAAEVAVRRTTGLTGLDDVVTVQEWPHADTVPGEDGSEPASRGRGRRPCRRPALGRDRAAPLPRSAHLGLRRPDRSVRPRRLRTRPAPRLTIPEGSIGRTATTVPRGAWRSDGSPAVWSRSAALERGRASVDLGERQGVKGLQMDPDEVDRHTEVMRRTLLDAGFEAAAVSYLDDVEARISEALLPYQGLSVPSATHAELHHILSTAGIAAVVQAIRLVLDVARVEHGIDEQALLGAVQQRRLPDVE